MKNAISGSKAPAGVLFGALLALATPEAGAQEYLRHDATLGALSARAGAVVEADVTAISTANGRRTAILRVARALKGQVATAIAVRTDEATSVSVPLASGERAIFLLEAGGSYVSAADDQASGFTAYEIEGSFLGKIETSSPEGAAVASQLEAYLATEGDAAARRAMLVAALSHWHPRIATDASYDLEAMGGALSASEAAAVIDALDRNRSTFEDIRALVRLAGRTSSRDAVLPLVDALEEGGEHLVTEIAAALGKTARGTNLVPALQSALAGAQSRALRAKCATTLGELGDATALPVLADAAVNQDDARVRLASIAALGKLGDGAAASLETIAKSTARPLEERRAAAVALAGSRAGALRLAALERTLEPTMAEWIGFVRANPAIARSRIAR